MSAMKSLVLRVALLGAALPLPVASASAQVQFDRTGYRLTSIGQQVRATARIAGANGSQPSIRWHIADPTIAAVSAQGVVEARKVGHTRLWAVAGKDSSSALILVDQWAAKFDFFPALVRLHAVGDRAPLRIQVRDAGGHLINGPARRAVSACRSMNERVASLGESSQITAHSNGVTYVRCTDRGVSDSVRVEVRQRAVDVTIVDKLGFANKVVADTFRIRVSAKDGAGGDIRNVQASWASLSPFVVSVDPLTGMARGAAAGTARIVAQVDDVTDTVTVTVLPGVGMGPVATNDTTGGSVLIPLVEVRPPTLHLQSLFLAVDDTARVSPRDGMGAIIENAEFRINALDSAVVRTISRQRVVALAPGNTYVYVQFGDIRDSLLVSVRDKSAQGVILAGGGAAAAPFSRPRFNTDSARVANRERLDSAAREIRRQSVVEIFSGRMANLSAVVMHAGHATRDTNFLDKRTGLLYGAQAEIAPYARLQLSGAYRMGKLSPAGAGEDLDVTEVEADITVRPAPWFGLSGGYVRRVTSTEIATQRWDFPRATASTRFNFVGGAIRTTTALSLLVGARYTGYLDAQDEPINPDPFSLSGEAGIEFHNRRFAAALAYYAERFRFPRVNNNTTVRQDLFSALRLKLGYQIGR
jgi:hypothetical protein